MLRKLIILMVLFCASLPVFGQSVDTAWVRTYNGPADSFDAAYGIALDYSGNTYVTGVSCRSGTDNDYATIKYDSRGDQLWAVRYNGPGNSYDAARATVVDKSGNVYVTGYSWVSGTAYDYATIKYDALGTQLWAKRYNGPANSDDEATAIVVDTSGNVYVTGFSWESGTWYNYITIKYDSLGNQLWVKRYDGPANSADWAEALAIDASGNAYVTGRSYGSGTDYDYATIKYDSQGNQLWVERYNGPANSSDWARALAVDNSGNAYVTGYTSGSGTHYDYTTIKYDFQGNQLWVERYNGPANSDDDAYAIAIGGSGNVYVTGFSFGLGTVDDYATIKYDSAGNQLWVREYNGPANSYDQARAMAIDNSGNIYVTGSSYGSGTNVDFATIKYDSQGNQIWAERYNGLANGADWAWAITLDNSGGVYVAGLSPGIGTGDDYATIKYVQFQRGDADNDKRVTVSDVIYIINYLFKDGHPPIPLIKVADADCDGFVKINDVIYLINYLFKGGPMPCI